VPPGALHLALPAWGRVTLSASPADGDTEQLRQKLIERAECVAGVNAPLPVADVEVFPDPLTALTQAHTQAAGRWCAALPRLGPIGRQSEKPFRGLVHDHGIEPLPLDQPYAVVSHNWPRLQDPPLVHASVLGIWWALPEPALRQAETALALARRTQMPVWVDFLCIDQENADEKQVLIPDMGLIFSKSNAGFIDCTRTPFINTLDPSGVGEILAIGASENALTNDDRRRRLKRISKSQWFTRCWTFQEELLSPGLQLYDPSRDAVIGDFAELRRAGIDEFNHMHDCGGHPLAKAEGWFPRAVSFVNNQELISGNASWNVGNLLTIRGPRWATEVCDQVNSLLGILQARCNYRLSATTEFTDETFADFLKSCSENGDTSWLVGEDRLDPARPLSWAPSRDAYFTTQAEAKCAKWLEMTEAGPVMQFHSAYPVAEILRIDPGATADAMFAALRARRVCGAWLLEYCGVTFGAKMEHPQPMSAAEAEAAFAGGHQSYRQFEDALIARGLPDWRAKELESYLMGMPHREEGTFNAWLVFDTPSRRLAVMAKLIAPQAPQELLFGYPAASKHRNGSHCFFPIFAVDGSSPRRRVGWVWPCCHATLTASETESADCIRCISACTSLNAGATGQAA
jgi:hypothetical protein